MNARAISILAILLVGLLLTGVYLAVRLARNSTPEDRMTKSGNAAGRSTNDDELFLSERHPRSGRHAILEDDGQSCWLYLTQRDSTRTVTDVWVYNRVPPPPLDKVESFAPSPPPAAAGYAGKAALIDLPKQSRWRLIWSEDGEAVAVAKDDQPVAFVRSGEKPGFSRRLLKDGPWGKVWSDSVYQQTFQLKQQP